jgi:hypothetical protein
MTTYLIFPLGLALYSARYLRKGGPLKVTPDRIVPEALGRPLTLLLLIGAAIDTVTVLIFGRLFFAGVLALVAALVIGLAASKRVA